jgi:hypothetical protein
MIGSNQRRKLIIYVIQSCCASAGKQIESLYVTQKFIAVLVEFVHFNIILMYFI